jgi:2-oxoglutarate dehydrogenase complex dehydrogenase (E1) component-like enzyme
VDFEQLEDLNSGFVQELFAQYLLAPESVDPEWRELFDSAPETVAQLPLLQRLRDLYGDGLANGANGAATAEASEAPPSRILLGGVAAAMALVKAHRTHGHLAAHLDPLGSEPPGDPALDPDRLEPRLTPELQAQIPAKLLRLYVEGDTLAEALPHLRETYCGTRAYEIEHISSHEQRVWLRRAIESGRYRSSRASPRSRASRSTCAARSSGRSRSPSKASTRWSRCSTRRSSWRRRAARARS